MGNGPSIIARPTPAGFEGRYIHNDGWPVSRLPLLRHLYNTFGRNVDAMTAFLIDQHPAGWSRLGTDPHADTRWIGATGSRIGEDRFVCYCHGDRHEPPQVCTQADAAALADWVYVLTPDGIQVLTVDEDSHDQDADPCGDRLTWKASQLVPWSVDTTPDDAADLTVLHRRVLESTRALMNTGHMVSMADIARHAWGRLTEQERADAIPQLLVAYVTKVSYEESHKVYARDAADPDLHSYLRPSDVPLLWESHADPNGGPDQAIVDRGALLRLLCEDELLRHRLDMARGETASEA